MRLVRVLGSKYPRSVAGGAVAAVEAVDTAAAVVAVVPLVAAVQVMVRSTLPVSPGEPPATLGQSRPLCAAFCPDDRGDGDGDGDGGHREGVGSSRAWVRASRTICATWSSLSA